MPRKPVTLIDLMTHLTDQDEAALDVQHGATGASSLRHEHSFIAWGDDTRFERCTGCGAVRRPDRISQNPCVEWWGRGPAGKTCGECTHLERYRQQGTWFKCALREQMPGQRYHGDHRRRWEACAKFEPEVFRAGGLMNGDAEVVLLPDGRYSPMVGGRYFIIEHPPKPGEVLSRAVRISFASEREAQRFLELSAAMAKHRKPGGK